MSGPPPGVKPTRMRTGFVGYTSGATVCANSVEALVVSTRAESKNRVVKTVE